MAYLREANKEIVFLLKGKQELETARVRTYLAVPYLCNRQVLELPLSPRAEQYKANQGNMQ